MFDLISFLDQETNTKLKVKKINACGLIASFEFYTRTIYIFIVLQTLNMYEYPCKCKKNTFQKERKNWGNILLVVNDYRFQQG